jgi:hypothetical protein
MSLPKSGLRVTLIYALKFAPISTFIFLLNELHSHWKLFLVAKNTIPHYYSS